MLDYNNPPAPAYPPVLASLTPENAYRVHFLTLASAARASLRNAHRQLAIRSVAYRDRVAALPCGAQDGEAATTESIEESERFAWALADTIGSAIRATYPESYADSWGKPLRDAADNARLLSEVATTTPHGDAADALYADALARIRDELEAACAFYRL